MAIDSGTKRNVFAARWTERRLALVLTVPPLLFLLAFTLYPILRIIWMSFHRISVTQPWLGTPFIGLDNYVQALHDHRFWYSLGMTLAFATITVGFELVIGLALALFANRSFPLRSWARAAILFPWVLPTVTNALTWRWMFNQDYGIINGLLLKIGLIQHPLNWLGSSKLAFAAVCIVAIWKTSSFMALILLSGLQSIPSSLYEASRIDGASRVQTLFRVTLPLLRNTILVALVLRTLAAMQAFDLVFGLTQGGPGNSTETLPMYIHTTSFIFMEWGYGSAMGVLLFLATFILSAAFVKWLYDPDR